MMLFNCGSGTIEKEPLSILVKNNLVSFKEGLYKINN